MMNMLLGWMRALTDAIWRLVESPGPNSIFSGFGTGWLLIALVLIAAGIVIDWIVWMIRWQPYHVWATRLRAIRRLFGQPVEIVEPVGYDYHTAQYMPVDQVDEVYDQVDTAWDEQEAYDGQPYERPDDYDDETYETYEIYDDDSEHPGADPHAAYRRPALQFPPPPAIPDSQFRDYPGKRYDPARMPQVPPRDTVLEPLDPLAAYDAYPEAPPKRRTRRRVAADASTPAPTPAPLEENPIEETPAELEEQGFMASRRRRKAVWMSEELPQQEPIEEPAQESRREKRRGAPNNVYPLFGEPEEEEPQLEPELAYEPEYEYEQEETFDADDLPDPPQWPKWGDRNRPPKASFLARVRKQGEDKDPYRIKKRGMIAQMLDPQVDSIKGLPPRVDINSAFQKPTYPEPYGREPVSEGSPWDEDM